MSSPKPEGFQISFLPWIKLGPMNIGPVHFRPFFDEETRKLIKEETVLNYLDTYFKSFVGINGDPVHTITIVYYKNIDLQPPPKSTAEIRKAVDAYIFSVIASVSVSAVEGNNRSMGPPSAERFQLFHKNFTPDSNHIAIQAGNNLYSDKMGAIAFSIPLSIGGFVDSSDKHLLQGLGRLLEKPKSKKIQERLFRCLEWFRYAHVAADEVSDFSKIVMMATAFEMALEVPAKQKNKQKLIADKLERDIDCEGLRKSKRKSKNNDKHTRVGWWAREFYTLRNNIAHGDIIAGKKILFHGTQVSWMTHAIMADAVLYYYIKKLLFKERYWGDDVRRDARRTAKVFSPESQEAEKAFLRMVNNPDNFFRSLGWLPQMKNTAVARHTRRIVTE